MTNNRLEEIRARDVEQRFALFDTPEECAREAAPVFTEHEWRWKRTNQRVGHIPSEGEILEALTRLERTATTNYHEGGRLIYHNGRFGYQRPLGVLVNNIWERED